MNHSTLPWRRGATQLVKLASLALLLGTILVSPTTPIFALDAPDGPVAEADRSTQDGADPAGIEDTFAGWRDESPNSPAYNRHTLRGVSAVDDLHAWAVGGELDEDCVLLRTNDGGLNWIREGCPRNKQMVAVHFHDRNVGYAAGRDGTLFKSTNGGDDWVRIDAGTGSTLTAMHFLDASTGWTVTRSSRVQHTTNGGGSWEQSTKLSESGLLGVHFVDRNTGFAVGSDGLILRSSDSGRTWTKMNSGTDRRFHDVVFSDPKNGWVAGNDIRYSDNIGGSWTSVHEPGKTIEALDVESPGIVWAVGDEGQILRSGDNGRTWSREANGLTDRGLRDVVALPGGTVWAVGTGGRILHRIGDPVNPPTAVPPTRVPPTAVPPPTNTPRPTNTPLPTLTPTPMPTATPGVPWIAAEWRGGAAPIYIGHAGERSVDAVFGNMPATGVLSATIDGPAVFTTGEKSFSTTVLSRNGAGSFGLVLRPEAGATTGETFTLRLALEGATSEREGLVAWQALLGWLVKNKR
jgi:photosystem II stability/assembly factor-like uncharacterized protein